MRLWDLRTSAEVDTFFSHDAGTETVVPSRVNTACFSADERTILSASDVGDLCLWDIRTGRFLSSAPARATHACLGPGGIVAAGTVDCRLMLYTY